MIMHYAAADHEGWVDVKNLFPGGDYAKLRYWGLIERSVDSGKWRVTQAGHAWLGGDGKVQETAVVEFESVLRFEGREVTAHEAYGDGYETRRDVIRSRATKTAASR